MKKDLLLPIHGNSFSITPPLLKRLVSPSLQFCRVWIWLLTSFFILSVLDTRAQDVLVGLTSSGGKLQGGTAFTMKSDGTGYTIHREFARSGSEPYGDLIKASDGNFYGMTSGGGFGFGTVFKMTAAGDLTVLHSFNGTSEGSRPFGSLFQAPDGNFYGMTYEGGSSGNGTIFKITQTGTYTVLHDLDYTADGAHPYGSLIKGTDNNFYGMTGTGGANNYGTIFRITPTGTYTVLRHLNSSADGAYPQGDLVLGGDGNFYGMTLTGGIYGYGTIFRITPAGTYTVRRHLDYSTDGGYPNRNNLIKAADGNFYGMIYQGGTFGYGTIFKMTPGGTFTVLKNLDYTTQGSYPKGSLTQQPDGNFYGMMQSGGSVGYGTVFKMTPGGTYTVLKNLDETVTGGNPQGSLVRNSTDGNFYGMTSFGGSDGSGLGTIFKITPGGTLSVLVKFPETGQGIQPVASVVQAADGNFYGMTGLGGINDYGTVFKFCTGTFSTIKSLDATTTGSNPQGSLVQAPDGNFYGTSQVGGTYGYGTIFKISPGGTLTVLWNLDYTNDGAYPSASLVRGTDGNLYGTASYGGTNGYGTIFKITTSGSVFTVLRHLDFATTGGSPFGSLVRGKDNNFYGITYQGGTIGYGTIFKITPTGTLTVIKNLDNTNGGYSYNNSLIQGSDGNFYGMTQGGGATGRGVIFKIAPSGNPYIVLRDFDLATDGGNPRGDLVQGTDGRLYGMTSEGGMNGGGTIFRISTGGTFNVLRHLNPATDGSVPLGNLIIQKANPVANAQNVTTAVNTPKAITLTGSGGTPLTFKVAAQPQHGTLTGSNANRVYTPDPGFTGTDSFNFRVIWGCQSSTSKTVTINVGTASTVRLNTGGSAVATSLGSFSADNYFSGTTSVSTTAAAIANTTNDALYQDNRRATNNGGSFQYNIPVSNGSYTVKLHFAEIFHTAAGQRKFNVTAEGASWLSNYDIYTAAGGAKRALIVSKTINVSDGTLNLRFTSTVDKACVAAIEVVPVAGAERLEMEVEPAEEGELVTSLYPNPVKTNLTVQLTAPADKLQTAVVDATGREVLLNAHEQLGRDKLQINVASLQAGLYLLQLQTEQGHQILKFMKE
ncbi:hypothetical protein AHMF7605_15665 [Adhaeribacter arboris]|uniref:Secretion system C-terminal sorting domain-containing protein n=1 Tax=Adhaeribacter arboris TaxID=2072846 RepID=A0A2T2YH44_9BACT|nr:choice-of-anchor tandem repeat GloVer-containing protein [Adhaeribacter arboris]PSR54837.1 hypothetical protein AHMF7605_15665 [Adhaeribacter arboris]